MGKEAYDAPSQAYTFSFPDENPLDLGVKCIHSIYTKCMMYWLLRNYVCNELKELLGRLANIGNLTIHAARERCYYKTVLRFNTSVQYVF